MFFKQIETKSIAHYSYMVGDGDDLAVIDPVRDIGVYMREARKAGMTIKYILETHRNEDYVSGSKELGEKTGASIYISAHEDLGYRYGEKIQDGFELEMGKIKIKALHTPGHTLGHLSYVLFQSAHASPYMVFTGDSLFMGDVGRTDFYGEDQLEKTTGLLYDSIFEKLLPLGDELLMFPAHGKGSACGETMEERPFSTLGYEKKYNPVLQVASKNEFIANAGKMKIKPQYFNRMEVLNVEGAPFIGEEIVLNSLSFEKIKEIREDVILVDIRAKEAFIGGHIPGSIYMSKRSISTFLGALYSPDEKIVFVMDDHINDLEEIYWYCKRIGFDNILGFFHNGATQWEKNGEELEKVSTIYVEKYLEIPADQDLMLLDIRKEHELKESDPSEKKRNIPLQVFHEHLDDLVYDIPIYLLCNSGERATIAYAYLESKGFNPVVITGGIEMLEALHQNS